MERKKTLKLNGTESFLDLSDTDSVLAGRYCNDPRAAAAFEGFKGGFLALEPRFGGDSRAYNAYLVEGLQPRIAELAFAKVYETVTGGARADLRDLRPLHHPEFR